MNINSKVYPAAVASTIMLLHMDTQKVHFPVSLKGKLGKDTRFFIYAKHVFISASALLNFSMNLASSVA